MENRTKTTREQREPYRNGRLIGGKSKQKKIEKKPKPMTFMSARDRLTYAVTRIIEKQL
jgi:hypothetical protein